MYSISYTTMKLNSLSLSWAIHKQHSEISYKRKLALTLGQKQRQRTATVWPTFGQPVSSLLKPQAI